MNWREVSAVWRNRTEAGNGERMAFFWVSWCPSDVLPKTASGHLLHRVPELAEPLSASWPVKRRVWQRPVVPGEPPERAGLSWERAWHCQFTSNGPAGHITHPMTSHERWLSGKTLVLTISFLVVYSKPWEGPSDHSTEPQTKGRVSPHPGLQSITHWRSLFPWLGSRLTLWIKDVPEATAPGSFASFSNDWF